MVELLEEALENLFSLAKLKQLHSVDADCCLLCEAHFSPGLAESNDELSYLNIIMQGSELLT